MNKTEYLLVTLMEECSEIQKECSKCLRFGIGDKESYHNSNSTDDLSNIERLNNEVNDLIGVIQLLQKDGVLNMIDGDLVDSKTEKVSHFLEKSKPYLDGLEQLKKFNESIELLKRFDKHAKENDGGDLLPNQTVNSYPTKSFKQKVRRFIKDNDKT